MCLFMSADVARTEVRLVFRDIGSPLEVATLRYTKASTERPVKDAVYGTDHQVFS